VGLVALVVGLELRGQSDDSLVDSVASQPLDGPSDAAGPSDLADFALMGDPLGRYSTEIDRPRVVEGRSPDAAATDEVMLTAVLLQCRTLVTVEEGVVSNGFGAYLAGRLQVSHPEARVVPIGIPDILHDQAPRADQLELFGLTPAGVAAAARELVMQVRSELESRRPRGTARGGWGARPRRARPAEEP